MKSLILIFFKILVTGHVLQNKLANSLVKLCDARYVYLWVYLFKLLHT